MGKGSRPNSPNLCRLQNSRASWAPAGLTEMHILLGSKFPKSRTRMQEEMALGTASRGAPSSSNWRVWNLLGPGALAFSSANAGSVSVLSVCQVHVRIQNHALPWLPGLCWAHSKARGFLHSSWCGWSPRLQGCGGALGRWTDLSPPMEVGIGVTEGTSVGFGGR